MDTALRKTGINVLGDMPWGTHCCHFFETEADLLDTLIPYFTVGLEKNEFCLWVIHEPLTEAKVANALKQAVPHIDQHLANRSIEIVSSRKWYLGGGSFSLKRVMRGWNEKLAQALARGHVGMRANGQTNWLEEKDWKRFCDYEQVLNESIADRRMIVLCSYSLTASGAAALLNVARTHQFAIAKRGGEWERVEWKPRVAAPDLYETLTAREREVFRLAASGYTNPEIADRLSIGVRTVETHRANLMRKLGLSNQTELVLHAIQRGLLSRDNSPRRTSGHDR